MTKKPTVLNLIDHQVALSAAPDWGVVYSGSDVVSNALVKEALRT
jgi:hypothetical protein